MQAAPIIDMVDEVRLEVMEPIVAADASRVNSRVSRGAQSTVP